MRLQPKPPGEQSKQQHRNWQNLPTRAAMQTADAAPNRHLSLFPHWLLVLPRGFQQLELATGTAGITQLSLNPHETCCLVPLPHSPRVPVAQKSPQTPSPGTSQALHSSQHAAAAAAAATISLTFMSCSNTCSHTNSSKISLHTTSTGKTFYTC